MAHDEAKQDPAKGGGAAPQPPSDLAVPMTEILAVSRVTAPGMPGAIAAILPLGQAGMVEFEIIPLGPLEPLGMLLSEHSRP